VEELEFRSFSYDQSSRVLPNWQALLFSSVLFGCSHIPIALFVYQFPPHIFVVALFGWISAGVVFGALYMWSRNIFACIVMHGMGNWQLSVYYFQSTETGGMSVGSTVAVDIGTTLIADGAVIFIFFLIHKYYWQPHSKGEPAFGGRFANLQKRLHEHDFMQKPLQTTAVFLVVFIVVTCGIIMGLTHTLGESDLSLMYTTGTEQEGVGGGFLSSYIEEMEQQTDSGTLDEGGTVAMTLLTEPERYIQDVSITLTWEDEDDIVYGPRVYYNEPDTFSVRLSGLNQTERDSTSNPQGGQGEIILKLNFTLELLEETITTQGDIYEILIEIELVEAGEFFPEFGAVGFTDSSNDYSYELEITRLVPK
jgi:membrane protease YdiL (CAAX protease family)